MENERGGFGCGFIVFGPGWGNGLGVGFMEIKKHPPGTCRGPGRGEGVAGYQLVTSEGVHLVT